MNSQKDHLETLTEIRSIMERSSRFISLSGLSGVFPGIFALAGAAAAYVKLESSGGYAEFAVMDGGGAGPGVYTFFFIDAVLVLVASLMVGSFWTIRKARKEGQAVWHSASRRLLVNLLIPLVTGGLFCLMLFYYGLIGLVAPSMLIFYGLSLLNASKYTLNDIRYLGICEIILGLIASVFIGYGLVFWAIGFGVLHILYGIVVYVKYKG